MTIEQQQEQQELIASLRPGDVIEFRYTNRPKGEWPWSGDPFIFRYRAATTIHADKPFESWTHVINLNEVEVRVLARSGEQP